MADAGELKFASAASMRPDPPTHASCTSSHRCLDRALRSSGLCTDEGFVARYKGTSKVACVFEDSLKEWFFTAPSGNVGVYARSASALSTTSETCFGNHQSHQYTCQRSRLHILRASPRFA